MQKDDLVNAAPVFWEDARKDMVLPGLSLLVSYARAIHNVAAGRDFMRGHHEPAYATRQGMPDVFVNVTFHQVLVDRIVTDWAGPLAFIVRRRLRLADAIVAGDTVVGEGRVMRLHEDEKGRGLADVLVTLSNGRTKCTLAKTTVRMQKRA